MKFGKRGDIIKDNILNLLIFSIIAAFFFAVIYATFRILS